jgi:hypothetical protein
MRIDELTQEIIDDIFGICRTTAKSEAQELPNAEDVRKHLHSSGIFECRTASLLYSPLCENSRLIIAFYERINFSFVPDCDSLKRRDTKKGHILAESFGRAVQNYMAENHIS